MKCVLVAEDHLGIATTYKLILESKQTYEVIVTQNGQECIETFDRRYFEVSKEKNDRSMTSASQGTETTAPGPFFSACNPFDLVVLDYHLPEKDGIDVAKHILSMVPHQRILIASSYPRENIVKSAETLDRTVELMLKPFDLQDFLDAVDGLKSAETIGGKVQQEPKYAYISNQQANCNTASNASTQQQELLQRGEN